MTTQTESPRGTRAFGSVRPSGRSGFSLVEVIIAIVILAVGVLGLAGSTAYIVRQITFSDLLTERSIAFQTVIDRLQSLPYDSVLNGDDSVGVFYIRWEVTPDGAQSKMVRMWTTGPGMANAPVPTNNPLHVDSFDFRVLRR
ncbi:MAG: prepilin-type N-terminal cleavage/methylation domain-containing protein [Gemmatimonadetes bacterium]|nr:prepilin-type N-terminal cleavage/methylation domain-containing protein [Gemmatimonadota bacterium]NNF14294.1 prepilin-type N-terminal cleavage/methylation domain-containing protein [Gemmatimonadota bacterium]NNL29662.1 prepilin-type N-terminal cleavage/methylation domain-containing protein [Gemmatimonadota bacterium]